MTGSTISGLDGDPITPIMITRDATNFKYKLSASHVDALDDPHPLGADLAMRWPDLRQFVIYIKAFLVRDKFKPALDTLNVGDECRVECGNQGAIFDAAH